MSNIQQNFELQIRQDRAKVRSVYGHAVLETVPNTSPQQFAVMTAGGLMPPKDVQKEVIANGITPIFAWHNAAERI